MNAQDILPKRRPVYTEYHDRRQNLYEAIYQQDEPQDQQQGNRLMSSSRHDGSMSDSQRVGDSTNNDTPPLFERPTWQLSSPSPSTLNQTFTGMNHGNVEMLVRILYDDGEWHELQASMRELRERSTTDVLVTNMSLQEHISPLIKEHFKKALQREVGPPPLLVDLADDDETESESSSSHSDYTTEAPGDNDTPVQSVPQADNDKAPLQPQRRSSIQTATTTTAPKQEQIQEEKWQAGEFLNSKKAAAAPAPPATTPPASLMSTLRKGGPLPPRLQARRRKGVRRSAIVSPNNSNTSIRRNSNRILEDKLLSSFESTSSSGRSLPPPAISYKDIDLMQHLRRTMFASQAA